MTTSKRKRKSVRRPKLPSKLFYLYDGKGELFDVHTSRRAAWEDAVGPRFRRGFFIVEYVRRGMRKYKYTSTMPRNEHD